MNYQVWLHARHPKTSETVATVRVYAYDDRLRAEAVLENAQADHQPLVLALLQVHPGALVNAEMRHGKVPNYRALLEKYMALVLDAEGVAFIDHEGDHIELDEEERAALMQIKDEVARTAYALAAANESYGVAHDD